MPGLLARLHQRSSPENPATSLSNPAQWLFDWAGGSPTHAGEPINEFSALRLGAAWACIRCLAESLAQLPRDMYEYGPNNSRQLVREHPVSQLVRAAPNENATGFTFFEAMQGHVVSWGNGYAELERAGGQIVGMNSLMPDVVTAVIPDGATRVWYEDRTEPASPRFINPRDILHVPGFGFNGITGYAVIAMHRETLGYATAARNYGSRYFKNGAKPSGLMSLPGRIDGPQARELSDRFGMEHSGDNQHRTAVVGGGATWTQIGLPPNDSQFIETQEMLIPDVARIFRVPPHKIGYLKDAGDRANIEQENRSFLTETLLPYLKRFEAELNRKLFSPAERQRFFVEFNVDGLQRGDLATRTEHYVAMRNTGVYSANDIRKFENENPIPKKDGGDVRLVPLNMVPMDQVLEPTPAPAPPTEERQLEQGGESRALHGRRRTQRRFVPLVTQAYERVLVKETSRVLRAARRHLRTRDVATLNQWLGTYYETHPADVARGLEPVLQALAEQLGDQAADEVSAGTTDLEGFTRRYAATAGARYSASHLGQLRQLLRDLPEGELLDAIETRLGEWRERDPAKAGERESHQAGNAVTRAVWAGAGVTLLRWVSFGGCPLCSELNGVVVGIQRNFLDVGDQVTPGGGTSPLRVEHATGHPPLHQGCECMIAPGG